MKESIKVSGMMCEHCEKRVIAALKALGVKATASAKDGEVTFVQNGNVTREQIAEEIKNLGYDCP